MLWADLSALVLVHPGPAGADGITVRVSARLDGMVVRRGRGDSELVLWSEQSLPQQPDGTLVGCWNLVVPSDVSGARRRLRIAAAAEAVSDATTETRLEAGIEEAVEELLLVFEELASNGLRHGQVPVVARVQASAESWLVQVTDAAPGRLPKPAVDRDPALGGLGLHLVARLSRDFGWSVQGGRKHVWARLPTPSEVTPVRRTPRSVSGACSRSRWG